MGRTKALEILMREARSERTSNTSCKRLMRALKALDCDNEEIRFVLSYLDICNINGTPYSAKITRIWW